MTGDEFYDVALEDEGDDVVVRVRGEIDRHARDTLWAAIEAAGRRRRRLVFDLSGTTFIDGCGLGVIQRACDEVGGARGGVVVRGPSPGVRRLLALVGLDDVVVVELVRP
jgi:anti-anti-sigma factor